jgi:hypothetical protein
MGEPIWLLCLIVPLAFAAALVVFPLFWCFVVWMISLVSGWQRLAERYRTTRAATGQRWLAQYGLINNSRYANALDLTANEQGLFIEPVWLFRINHPRLFIPWQDFHNPAPFEFRWRHFVRVDVGNPPLVTMSLHPDIFEEGMPEDMQKQMREEASESKIDK